MIDKKNVRQEYKSVENCDSHKAAKEIIKRLRSEGFHGRAQMLEDAIAGGATGTEICMAVRWNLKK